MVNRRNPLFRLLSAILGASVVVVYVERLTSRAYMALSPTVRGWIEKGASLADALTGTEPAAVWPNVATRAGGGLGVPSPAVADEAEDDHGDADDILKRMVPQS